MTTTPMRNNVISPYTVIVLTGMTQEFQQVQLNLLRVGVYHIGREWQAGFCGWCPEDDSHPKLTPTKVWVTLGCPVLQPGCDPSQEFGENGLQIDMLSWVEAKILVGNYCIIYFACQYPNLYCWASFLGSFGQVSIFPSVHSINTHPQQFFGISLVEMDMLSYVPMAYLHLHHTFSPTYIFFGNSCVNVAIKSASHWSLAWFFCHNRWCR